MGVRLHILTDEGHRELELDISEPITLNYTYSEFTRFGGVDDTSIKANYSLSIKLPVSCENGLSPTPDVAVSEIRDLINAEHQALLEFSGITNRGALRFISASKQEGNWNVNAQFVGGTINFFNQLPEKLWQIGDFGILEKTQASIEANMLQVGPYGDGNDPFYYSLKNYGGINGDSSIPLEYMRPDIHLSAIIEQIEQYTGIRIKSQFFQTDFFKNLLLSSGYFKGRIDGLIGLFVVDTDISFAALPNQFLGEAAHSANLTISEGLDIYTGTGDLNIPPQQGNVDATVKFDVNLLNDFMTFRLTAGLIGGAGPILDSITFLNPGQYTFELSGVLPSGTNNFHIEMIGNPATPSVLGAGSEIKICWSGTDLSEADPIYASDYLPDEDTTKFLRGLSDAFNLVFFYNECTDELCVEPKYDYTIPATGESGVGFIRYASSQNELELTDCLNSQSDFSVDSDFSRELAFRWKDDSKDFLTTERTYEANYDMATKFKKGETVIENTFFAATIDKELEDPPANINEEIIIPTLFKDDPNDPDETNDQEFDFKPRLLYKIGPTNGKWRFNNVLNVLDEFPLATMVNIDGNVNLSYGDEFGINGLATIFRTKDIDVANFGQKLSVDGYISCCDLVCVEDLFRNLWKVNVERIQGKYMLDQIQLTIGDYSNLIKVNLTLVLYDV